MSITVKVIGGGLAGCEAAYQLLKRGYNVDMYEMRPALSTGAHRTGGLAELVCSNSLKSDEPYTSSGLLKRELDTLDCMLLRVARSCKVEAGGALAVDRAQFSTAVEANLRSYDGFRLIREEVTSIDYSEPTVIATGPLTSAALSERLALMGGGERLHFYDAIAPIVSAASIDPSKSFSLGRYGKGDDYLNCPLDRAQYSEFYNELVCAQSVVLHDFEKSEIFEGCMPVEVMAKRGFDALRFGPMKPVGLTHPQTGEKFYAIVQLRKENVAGDAYNIVGFQTNLTFSEQKRVFSLIPALANAEFLRYGVMHRNTYLNSPQLLDATFRVKDSECVYVAGQLSGVEGYVESIMSGLLAGIHLSRRLFGAGDAVPPRDTIIGELSRYVTNCANVNFQPMNSNFALLTPVSCKDKNERKKIYCERAMAQIIQYAAELDCNSAQ